MNKFKKFLDDNGELFLFFVVLFGVFFVMFTVAFFDGKNIKNSAYYGNEEYIFCEVHVDYGRQGRLYSGALKVDEYDRWLNGDDGTIFLHSAYSENLGWYINISSITTISNRGCAPEFFICH